MTLRKKPDSADARDLIMSLFDKMGPNYAAALGAINTKTNIQDEGIVRGVLGQLVREKALVCDLGCYHRPPGWRTPPRE